MNSSIAQFTIGVLMLAAVFVIFYLCARHYGRRLDKMTETDRMQEWLDDQW